MPESAASRIYVDNAATSWPKPEAVYQAVDQYLRRSGAPAGRSGYQQAAEVDRSLKRLRQQVLQLLDADPRDFEVVFTYSGTDALNTAIHGLLHPGDHVVTTHAEHNSVLRPLEFLTRRRQVQVTRVRVDASGWVDPDELDGALRAETRLVVLVHASNVTGTLQPIDAVGRITRERGIPLLIDAAQSLGSVPISLTRTPADMLAAPGHKGLLGPLGTGLLVIRRSLAEQLDPFRQGGTGSKSESDRQPDELPDRFEAGNANVAGLIGLLAGVEYVLKEGIAAIHAREQQLLAQLEQQLDGVRAIRLYGVSPRRDRVAVLSLAIDGLDPREAAAALDAAEQIQVRAGLHCAPNIHKAIGADPASGTLRISLGPFNTSDEVDRVARAIGALAGVEIHPLA